MKKSSEIKKDLWLSRIMACRKSGMPDTRWCKENDVSPSSLYYWIKKLRMEAHEILVSNDTVAVPYKQDIVPLHIIEDHPLATSTQNVPAIILHMGSITLEIQNMVPMNLLLITPLMP